MILYFLVCGYLPFSGENENATYKKIRNGKVIFPDGVHGQVSIECIELIILMLKVDV